MSNLSDTGSVIDALGGTSAVAHLLGCGMQRVSNWRSAETFPADTFEPITAALARIGQTASLRLWRTIPTDTLRDVVVLSPGARPPADIPVLRQGPGFTPADVVAPLVA